MKLSTLATWSCVALLTLFIYANWRTHDIYLLPGVWAGEMPLSLALGFAAGIGFALAHFVRVMNKDKGGDKKK